MRNIIKKILRESLNDEKYFIESFKIIDNIFSISTNKQDKEDLLDVDDIYTSSDSYGYVFDYFTEKFGYDIDETHKIIGSYIQTNLENEKYRDSLENDYSEGIIISKPKPYVAKFNQYVSGRQHGEMTSDKNFSQQEAMFHFRRGYYDDWVIVDDNTETDEFDIDEVFLK